METREPEVWKPIPGYEGLYEVSSWGNVKTVKRYRKCNYGSVALVQEKILKRYVQRRYLSCILTKDAKSKNIRIHRVVYKVFVDKSNRNTAELEDINHIDSDKLNNYFKNLEEVSKRENQTHRYLNQKTSSKYPGVYFVKDINRKKQYRSQFQINGIIKHVGYFLTEIEAYNAYLNALKEYGIENKYATQSQ